MDDVELTDREVPHELERRDVVDAATTMTRLAGVISAVFIAIGIAGIALGGLVAQWRVNGEFDKGRIAIGVAIAMGSLFQIGIVTLFTGTAGLIARHVRYHAKDDGLFDQ